MSKYIVKYLKILYAKLRIQDFLFTATIVFLLFRGGCNKPGPYTEVKTPELAKTEQITDKVGNKQSVIKEAVLTKPEMKEATKDIRKNLKVDQVNSVTKDVITLDIKTPDVPVTINDLKKIVTDQYVDKNISVFHVYNMVTKTGNFAIHLTPDTMTIVNDVTKHLFKPDEHQVHINHTNDYLKDSLASSFTYKDPGISLVIGPSIGATIWLGEANKILIRPSIGVTATIPVIVIKKRH